MQRATIGSAMCATAGPQFPVPTAARDLYGGTGRDEADRVSAQEWAGRAEPARDDGRAVRRARNREPESLAEPALRSAGSASAVRGADAGGLLLQDVHVACAILDVLRAADQEGRRTGTGSAPP